MKEFLRKNKISVIIGAILIAFTVLLCIPATIKVFAGVFGYVVYFYLALGYAALVLRILRIKIPVGKLRLALYIVTVALIIMTLHVGIIGKQVAESSFGEYITYSYNNPTVAGVLFSIISSPIVLLCKYIASVVIFFVLTAAGGFFIIRPYIFEGVKTPEHRIIREKEPEKVAPPAPSTTPSFHDIEEEPEQKPLPEPIEEEKEELPPVDSKEYARMMLFGDKADQKKAEAAPRPAPAKTADEKYSLRADNLDKQKKSSSYNIVDGVDAVRIRPNDDVYTNNYLEKQREEARQKLFSTTLSEDYAIRYGQGQNERTIREETAEVKINPYIPSTTIYEKEEPEEILEAETHEVSYPTPDYSILPDEETEYEATDDNADDELPTARDSVFMQALRSHGDDAPAPLDGIEEAEEEPEAIVEDETPKDLPIHSRFEPMAVPTKEPEQKPAEVKVEEKPVPPPVVKKPKKPYVAPPIDIFVDHPPKKGFTPYVENYDYLKEVFEEKLSTYGLSLRLIDAKKGPTVTFCTLALGEGCSVKKVTAARQDISLLLKSKGDINIVPQIPGTSYFGIEIPNLIVGSVSFKEVISSREYAEAEGDLLLALGKYSTGDIVIDDLASMPHALIAGSSGSGKSVCMNVILASLLYRYSPDQLKLVLVDMKLVEMINYSGLPHMLFKRPLNEPREVMNAFNWLQEETVRRFQVLTELRVRDLNAYNAKVDDEHKMSRIVIIIDEASELMMKPETRKVIEAALSSIARIGRAGGVHMIFATQTPSKDVITSEIQNNLNTKIAFAVGEYTHSMVIFKAPGAEKLLGKGDMLIKKNSTMQRAQCAFVDTDEIDNMVNFILENNEADFDEELIERILHGSKEEIPESTEPAEPKQSTFAERKNPEESDGFVDFAKEVLKIFVEQNRVSATYIQRKFSKGYNTVANVMDYLEEKGYVSPQVNNKRQLLITKSEFYNLYPEMQDPTDDMMD